MCNFAAGFINRQNYKMFGISKHYIGKKKYKSYKLWHHAN